MDMIIAFLYKDSVRFDGKDGNWHINNNQNIARITVNGNEYTFFDKGKLVRKLHRGE